MTQNATSVLKPPLEGLALLATPAVSFQGFGQFSSFTPIPDFLLDELMAKVSGAEFKIMVYIIRRTSGFGKLYDAISYNQFLHGITTRDGRRLDYGTGLARSTLAAGLARLVQLGYIFRHEGKSRYGTVYELNIDGVPHYGQNQSENQSEDQSENQSENQPENQTAGSSIIEPGAGAIITLPTGTIIEPLPPDEQIVSEGSSIIVPESSTEIVPGDSPIIELTINSSPINSYQKTVSQGKGLTETDLRVGPEELEKRKLSDFLAQQGINQSERDRLARLLLANGRDEAYIQGWTAWIARQDFIERPAAYLHRVIERDEELPAAAPVQAARARDPHQRKGAGLDFSKYGRGGKYGYLTGQAKPRNWRFNEERGEYEEVF